MWAFFMVLLVKGVYMLIHYKCEDCGNTKSKYYRKAKEIEDEIECDKCHEDMERQLGAPATKSTQFIDNGLQSRRVEVSSEVVEQERQKLNKDD